MKKSSIYLSDLILVKPKFMLPITLKLAMKATGVFIPKWLL